MTTERKERKQGGKERIDRVGVRSEHHSQDCGDTDPHKMPHVKKESQGYELFPWFLVLFADK